LAELAALPNDADRRTRLVQVAQKCADILCKARPAFSWLIDGLFRRILLLEKNRFVAVTFDEEDSSVPGRAITIKNHFVYKGVDVTQGGICWALSRLRREIFTDMVLTLPPRALDKYDKYDVEEEPKEEETKTKTKTKTEEREGEEDVPYDTTTPRAQETKYRLSIVRSHIVRRIKQWVISLKQGAVPSEHFVILQRLSQALDLYDDDAVKHHGHVQAARLLHAAGAPLCGADQAIEFVWCTSILFADANALQQQQTQAQAQAQAFPYRLLRKDTHKFFSVHVPWYVTNQFVPELQRDIKHLGLDLPAARLELLFAL
jgi:hypothetical protein